MFPSTKGPLVYFQMSLAHVSLDMSVRAFFTAGRWFLIGSTPLLRRALCSQTGSIVKWLGPGALDRHPPPEELYIFEPITQPVS